MTATTTDRAIDLSDAASGRDDGGDDRLAVEAGKIRSRQSLAVDKWFQIAGGVLLCLGVLAIIGGWYGVSHTAREWRQTPYLLSGGLLGLGLIFIGGFAYFAYWMTKMVEQGQRQTAVLERIEFALARQAGDASVDGALVVAAGGVVHRPSCPLATGRTDLRPFNAAEEGVRPCPMCEPDLQQQARQDDGTSDEGSAGARRRRS